MKNVNNKYLSYADQLKHSLWKEKRNSILLERGSKCERCGDTNHLHIVTQESPVRLTL